MNDQVGISRILHAGYILQTEISKIIFDPIFENPFSYNCYSYPDICFDYSKIVNLKADAIFISHFHDDHFSLESLNYLDKNIPIYIYCKHQEAHDFLKEIGFKNVVSIKLDSTIQICDFAVTARKALDLDVDTIFQIQVKGLNILNVVDSWIDDETMKLLSAQSPWDLILWPFQTMQEMHVLSPSRIETGPPNLPIEWKNQIKQLNARYIVPSSCQFIHEEWSWYRDRYFPISYAQFHSEIKNICSTEVVRLDPGQTIFLDKQNVKFGDELDWIHVNRSSQVDYAYNPESLVPSTALVAKKFPEIDNSKIQFLDEYLEKTLLEKFAENVCEYGFDDFFEKKRIWKLVAYFKEKKPKEYFYTIEQSKISLTVASGYFDWLTEIPAFKLYSAVTARESLSSIYIRINDYKFSQATEKDLRYADILSDPLLSVLYSADVLSYQRNQLEKIKSSRKIV